LTISFNTLGISFLGKSGISLELDKVFPDGDFGEIGDGYFESLITQFDFTTPKTFCRNVGSLEISFYRTLGMALFYVLSYLRKPSRMIRLLKCLFQKGPFQPNTLFEQRIFDVIARNRADEVRGVES